MDNLFFNKRKLLKFRMWADLLLSLSVLLTLSVIHWNLTAKKLSSLSDKVLCKDVLVLSLILGPAEDL